MPSGSKVLVIEKNFAERARILQKFKEHQLRHEILFVNNSKEALIELYFFNKEIKTGLPQIILLSPDEESMNFLITLKEDKRYKNIKSFFLVGDENYPKRENLYDLRVSGIVHRSLDFKHFSHNETYLDTIDLFLHLVRLTVNKTTPIGKENR